MYLLNISNSLYDLEKFGGQWKDFEKFLINNKFDGIELILYKDQYLEEINPSHLVGLHLQYYPTWLEFFREDHDALKQLYASEKEIINYYGSLNPKILIEKYQKEYKKAQELGVKYMVFHVAHVTNEDAFSFDFSYTDDEVMEATTKLVNAAFEEESEILLLFENLWWPGMTLLDYKKTKKFLDSIHYKNKGIMLDLSHMIITNPALKSSDEATDYILENLEKLGGLKKYIKGIHLNYSLSGQYIKENHKEKYKTIIDLEDAFDRYKAIVSHIKNIDEHLPYQNPRVKEIINIIDPNYIVYEFSSKDINELEGYIKIQHKALGRE